MKNGWLTIQEVAARLGVSNRRVQCLVLYCRISVARRLGRAWAIPANFRVSLANHGPKPTWAERL